ncbi:PREDICTED: DEAD-box ATP-dependent RNA helicase 5 [Nelumbo nucifera]|uniref:RNA helicase n=1 Tax=Nelumbo nucifera TaxID=4432 RepID=A0A1U8AGS9_NELNU|nr:PREDICTED: DEAD-box ATP-dependent RNA helicase 5 [Nelumbo nucifera]XP_010261620.1 PREDICTED: DEAD-box ATP-dependent RNA helicase 5 [Nelumbo nucifera]
MGRKFEEVANFSKPEMLEAAENHEIKSERKKKKKKKKEFRDSDFIEEDRKVELLGNQKEEVKRKRKSEEVEVVHEEIQILEASEGPCREAEDKKRKKKKKKEKRAEEENSGKELDINHGICSDTPEILDKEDRKQKKSDGVGGRKNEDEIKMGGNERDEAECNNGVVVSGKNTQESKYAPLSSFAESHLPDEVLECCKNFSKPSPIQSHAWPFLLDGRDFIGIAATGSGKTLAFGVPALMHILHNGKKKKEKKLNPLCLVLSPTRELAQQIADVLSDAGKTCGVKSVCLYGGTSKGPQISCLKSGVDIVIGTPGRLKDLMEMGVCCLKEVSFVVLDEADRMLDMGFEPEVRSILSQTCSVRQMVMFSATWPLSVHQLAQEFMDPNPVKVVVGSEDLAANHDVMQIVEVLDDRSRDARLVSLLEKYHKSQRNRVLVFVLYKKEAVRVENMLQRRGWKVVSVHGDKAQHDRTKALSLFKEGTCPLMIATDVAARGLDIPDVEVVINYSFPLTTEDYVHRIGRTGRAGKKGVAHTFFMQENKGLAGELVNVLREAGQIVPAALMKFGTHVKKKESKLYGAHFKEIAADAPKSTKIKFDNSDEED